MKQLLVSEIKEDLKEVGASGVSICNGKYLGNPYRLPNEFWLAIDLSIYKERK